MSRVMTPASMRAASMPTRSPSGRVAASSARPPLLITAASSMKWPVPPLCVVRKTAVSSSSVAVQVAVGDRAKHLRHIGIRRFTGGQRRSTVRPIHQLKLAPVGRAIGRILKRCQAERLRASSLDGCSLRGLLQQRDGRRGACADHEGSKAESHASAGHVAGIISCRSARLIGITACRRRKTPAAAVLLCTRGPRPRSLSAIRAAADAPRYRSLSSPAWMDRAWR